MRKLPPPEMPAAEQPQDIPDVLLAIQAELNLAAKSATGYFTISRIYAQVVGTSPPNERRIGLPIFRHSGSMDGVNVVPVEIDLAHVPPEYLPSILAPICNVHYNELMGELEKIRTLVATALGTAQAAATRDPDA